MSPDAPGAAPDPASRSAAAEAARLRYLAARREVERLAAPDDHGSGERTARLANLAAWEVEVASALETWRALTGAEGEPGRG